MRECRRAKKLLSRYLDKEANDNDAAFVKKHLNVCHICNKDYLGLLKVKQFMLEKERKSLPRDYLISLLEERIISQQHDEEIPSWIAGMGNLSRWLIPVPITVIILSIMFLIAISKQQIDSYSLDEHILNGSQTTTEVALGLIMGTQN